MCRLHNPRHILSCSSSDLMTFRNVLISLGPTLLLPRVYFLVSFVRSLRIFAPRLVVCPGALLLHHWPCLPTSSKDARMWISWFQAVCWGRPVMWPVQCPPATVSLPCNPSLLLIIYPRLCLNLKVTWDRCMISCDDHLSETLYFSNF